MARKSANFVFTLNEIGTQAFEKWPGRWKNQESAYASVKAVAQRLEIGDINGKQKYKLIAAKDAARILEELEKRQRKTPQHGQADLFSLLPPGVGATITAGPVEVLTVQPATTSDEYRKETARQLAQAAEILQDALRVFCNCLIAFERGNA